MSSNSSFQGSANFANNAYDYLTDYNPTDDNIPSSNNIPVTFEGALVNESPGGYCISWEGNIPSSLHTGEIIALEHKQEQCEPYWVVGAIRWIKEISLDKAHIGVQFLGPCTKAARAFIAENHTEDLGVRALLLPALTSYGRPQTLITPPLPFKEGTNVSVVIDGKHMAIKKDPITDPGKASKAGRLDLIKKKGRFVTTKIRWGLESMGSSELRTVYEDGELLIDENLETIRARSWQRLEEYQQA